MRQGSIHDLPQLTSIASTLSEPFDYLRMDKAKLRLIVEQLGSGQHYFKVIEQDGQVVALLAALTNENLWAEKKCSLPIAWWSEKPGSGKALLLDYRDWVLSRPVLRFAAFAPQADWDNRINQLLIRAGFLQSGASFVLTR